MATWHETMMMSSDSFRECHENRGGEKPADIELVNDYVSITNQGGGHYWATPSYEAGFEAGKSYKVIINDEEFSGDASSDGNAVKLATGDEKLDIKYNTASGMYVINYYPTEDIGSNPTVNFEVWEVAKKEEENNAGGVKPIIINLEDNEMTFTIGNEIITAYYDAVPEAYLMSKEEHDKLKNYILSGANTYMLDRNLFNTVIWYNSYQALSFIVCTDNGMDNTAKYVLGIN